MQMKSITDFLDNSEKRFPDKIAFVDSNRSITFRDFKIESQKIATKIIEYNLFKKPIVVFLDKNINCLTSMFGVLYSGNFYTIIDVDMPIERVEKIFDTLQPELIVTDKKHSEILSDLSIRRVCVDEFLDSILVESNAIENCIRSIIDTDVAYVLFTSGSTGIPKGVVVSHKSVMAYTEWVVNTFEINESTIFGNQTPFYFSMSVTDIFSTVFAAATLYIIPKQLFTFPIKLLEFISEHKINTIYWVPSALCLVANLKALGKRDVSCLKKIMFAGEAMPTKQLNLWRKTVPDALYANLFGPTETTDICNYYIVNRELSDTETVPIGVHCNNCDLLILNDKNERVGKNEQGELCVRGSFLAYGYYNNPQKTNEVFVQNPLNPYYKEIIYRTGDLVAYNGQDEMIYLGRKDFQIKHMGHRIELGEIETAAASLDGMLENCALYDIKKDKIVLFYSGRGLDDKEVLEKIQKLVPAYMVPERLISMESLPHNLNGKIDRVLLKTQLGE